MDVVNITNPTTGIKNNEPVLHPDGFILEQNYPNPFNRRTIVKFYLPKTSEVRVEVFDSFGRLVDNLNHRNLSKGWHQIPWNGENSNGQTVASGHYICRLTAGSFQKSIIMQLLK